MDFANQFIEQLRELFASMTTGARLTAGLLLAVVVVSLAFLFQQSTSGPDEYLFGGEALAASQLNDMSAAMSQAGLSNFEIDGNRIRVQRGQKAAYLAAIADAGAMPTDVHRLMSDALDGGSVLDSSEVKKQRIQAARERQLSEIITLMPWVDQAHVLYDQSSERGLRGVRKASATVTVVPNFGEDMTPRRARNLQKLVAGWNVDMTPDQVTVSNLGDDTDYAGGSIAPEDFEHPLYATKIKVESHMRNQIMDQLYYIPGVRVNVKAVLDDTKSSRVTQVKPDQQPATLRETNTQETSEQSTNTDGGRPGVFAQGPNRGGDEVASRVNQSKTSNTVDAIENVVGASEEVTERYDLALQETWASIAVPTDYVVDIYMDRKLKTEGQKPEQVDPNELQIVEQEIKQEVEDTVQPLLAKLSLGEDKYKQLSVVFYDRLEREPPPKPSAVSNALAWAGGNWSSVAMGIVALVGLMMMRSVINGGPGDSNGPLASMPELQLETPGGAGDEEEEDDQGRPKLKLRKPETLKDDLADMVRSDPDAAAAILRNWIGNAS
ncbi:flagellar MS-ring protein [Pseudobythopirellula maris]|uniref:Flagellar MS-ring protein n=1 Tax=Pseudobythopirellula maris TaxID=2527991 RepID=A0A5C5ZJ11_9BACT|nr:hypothetical protein [Pseudobythopirellula maris]TWT86523.1 flagellar MS-ring protein [Pseudobythopirellula maris]